MIMHKKKNGDWSRVSMWERVLWDTRQALPFLIRYAVQWFVAGVAVAAGFGIANKFLNLAGLP